MCLLVYIGAGCIRVSHHASSRLILHRVGLLLQQSLLYQQSHIFGLHQE